MTFENYTNYVKLIPHLQFAPVDNETWNTICSEGLDEEQDSPDRKNWQMATLPISKTHSEKLKDFNDDAINGFNAFDIMLKDTYQGKLVDFIDYDKGVVKIVKSKKPVTEYDFIKNLSESALIRSNHAFKKYTARDIADLTFLYFLGLQILRSEFEGKPEAVTYAKKTIQWRDFDSFRTVANDLYILLYTLTGKNNESAIKNLNKQEASLLLINELQIHVPQAKQWLYNVSQSRDTSDWDKMFLMKLEAMLKIQVSDYRSVRRLVNEWPDLTQAEREIAMTRLLLAFRARASRSEILPMLEKIAKNNKLEIPVTDNPEKPSDPKKSQSWALAGVGAAIGAGLLANGFKNFVMNAGKAKKYTENVDLNSPTDSK